MIDQASQQRIALLHPKLRDEVNTLVEQSNAALTTHSQVRIVQGLRTFAEQDALYAQRPKVTNAKGGQSLHNYGVAVDFCLIIDGKTASWDLKKDWDGDKIADWMEVVSIFRKAGWEWGGTWKFTDNRHFQKTFGYTWQQLLVKHNNKDFIPGTTYVNI